MTTFYAGFDDSVTVSEIDNGSAGAVDRFDTKVTLYQDGDANNKETRRVSVSVVTPAGYELTDDDWNRLNELASE